MSETTNHAGIDHLTPDALMEMFADIDGDESAGGMLARHAFVIKALLVSALKSAKDDGHWRLNLVAYITVVEEMLSKLFAEFQSIAVKAERKVVRACRDANYLDADERKDAADTFGAASMRAASVYGLSVMLGSVRMSALSIAVRHAVGTPPKPNTATLREVVNYLSATLDERVAASSRIATAKGL